MNVVCQKKEGFFKGNQFLFTNFYLTLTYSNVWSILSIFYVNSSSLSIWSSRRIFLDLFFHFRMQFSTSPTNSHRKWTNQYTGTSSLNVVYRLLFSVLWRCLDFRACFFRTFFFRTWFSHFRLHSSWLFEKTSVLYRAVAPLYAFGDLKRKKKSIFISLNFIFTGWTWVLPKDSKSRKTLSDKIFEVFTRVDSDNFVLFFS